MISISICTVDGNIHRSKTFTWPEIQAELPPDGNVGHDTNGRAVFVRSEDEFIDFVNDCLTYEKSNDNQTFSLETDMDTTRTINVQHVVWWEVTR